MMIPQDIVRELQLEVETNLAKARETLVAAGVSGEDLECQLAAERQRLERWRDDVLALSLRLVREKLKENAITALKAAATTALEHARAAWVASGVAPDALARKVIRYQADLDEWLRRSIRSVRARIDEPHAPSVELQ